MGAEIMSESRDPVAAPRDPETALSAAYLRLLGHTQVEAAHATGIDPRTLGRWESCGGWDDVASEAADRWLHGAVAKARRALLAALEQPDGPLALRVLERVVPELAPPSQQVHLTGSLANINMDLLPDGLLQRLADGEHPLTVLSSLVDSIDWGVTSIAAGLPRPTEEDSDPQVP